MQGDGQGMGEALWRGLQNCGAVIVGGASVFVTEMRRRARV
jgi:hypothetical protein